MTEKRAKNRSDFGNRGGLMSLGSDVYVHETAVIKRPQHVSIGSHVAIDNGVIISTKLSVGDYVHIAPYVVMIGGEGSSVEIGDFAGVAAGTKIVAGSEKYTGEGLVGPTIPIEYREVSYSAVKFERFAGCGVNCSIMPGVTLSQGAILGANSLLTSDAEPWTIYVGSPAKPVKSRLREVCIDNARKLGYSYND